MAWNGGGNDLAAGFGHTVGAGAAALGAVASAPTVGGTVGLTALSAQQADAALADYRRFFGSGESRGAQSLLTHGLTPLIGSDGAATVNAGIDFAAGAGFLGARGRINSISGRTAPPGFYDAAELRRFSAYLRGGLQEAGYSDVQPILQGSAITGRNSRTGIPFDVNRVSDFDVALASPSLMERARALGIGMRQGGARTGPLSPSQLERLNLAPLARHLSNQYGREVNFMLYNSSEPAIHRAPSLILKRAKCLPMIYTEPILPWPRCNQK